MRQKSSTSGVSIGNWLALDHNLSQFDVGYAVVVTGSATFNIEYTYDNVLDPLVTSPTTFALLSAQTTTQDGQITKPIAGLRVNQTGGAGSTVLTVLQGTK